MVSQAAIAFHPNKTLTPPEITTRHRPIGPVALGESASKDWETGWSGLPRGTSARPGWLPIDSGGGEPVNAEGAVALTLENMMCLV